MSDKIKALRLKEREVSQTLEQIRDVVFGADRSKWFARSADEVAGFFGVGRRTVLEWSAKGMPHGKGYYPLDKIAKWRANRDKRDAADEDPLLAGDSPALEQYRLARARLAELDLAERESQLLRRDKIHEMLGRVAAVFRDAGDILQRQFGHDALVVIDEALNDSERLIQDLYADGPEDLYRPVEDGDAVVSEPVPRPKASNDKRVRRVGNRNT